MKVQTGTNPLRRILWLLVLAAGITASIGTYTWLRDMDARTVRHEIVQRSKVKLDAIQAIFRQHFDTSMAIGAFLKGEMGTHEYMEEGEVEDFARAMLDAHPDELAAIAIIPPEDSGEPRSARQDGAGGPDPSLDMQRLHRIMPGTSDIHPVQDKKQRWLVRIISSIENGGSTGYAISDWNTADMIDIAIAGTSIAGLDIEAGLIRNGKFTSIYRHRSRLRKTAEKKTEEAWRGGFSLHGVNFEVRTRAVPAVLRQLASTDPFWTLLSGVMLSLLLAYLAYNRSRYGERLRRDVAERTGALSAEHQTLHAILDQSPISIWMLRSEGRLAFINRTFCKATGVEEQAFLKARHYRDVLDHETARQCMESDAMAMAQDAPVQRVEQILFADGRRHPMDVTKVRLTDADGRPYALIGVGYDITDRVEHEWSRETLLTLRAASQEQTALHERLQTMLDCMFSNPWEFLDQAGAIFLVEGDTLQLAASHGWNAADKKRCASVPFGECLCGKAIEAGKTILHPHRPEEHRLGESGGADSGYLCIPLMHGGKQLGLINFRLRPGAAMPDAFHDFCRQAEEIMTEMLLRERTRQALEQSEEKFRSLSEQSPNMVFINQGGKVVFANQKSKEMMGYSMKELCAPDFDFRCLIAPESLDTINDAFARHMNGEEVPPYECALVTRDGKRLETIHTTKLVDYNGQPAILGIITDITGRKAAEERLSWLSYYDELTKLPNRRLFADRMHQAIAIARREKGCMALLYLDLDRFKFINDTLGHAAGDRVLRKTASRLQQSLRESDTAARMGGDEFAVLLQGTDANTAMRVASKVRAILQKPFQIGEQELTLDASIGIAIFPKDGEDHEALLKHADIAMYHAKANHSQIHYFSSGMEEKAVRRLRMEQELAKAADENQLKLYFQSQHALGRDGKTSPFPLHYQAKHRLDDGAIIGVEGLIRWKHPALGMVSPNEFIPLAEETGLIRPITHWVLAEAGRQAIAWEKTGIRPGRIGVNISAIQLMQKGLAKEILARIREAGAKPEWLEIEITETAAMREPETAIHIMRELVESGISIAIDDFGTGYSSLAYLKRLPAETLKIDITFIRDLPDDAEDAAIVRSIIAMAHALGMKTIAEGVETRAQLDFLRGEGCDAVQGYLLGKPLPADKATAHIKRNIKARGAAEH